MFLRCVAWSVRIHSKPFQPKQPRSTPQRTNVSKSFSRSNPNPNPNPKLGFASYHPCSGQRRPELSRKETCASCDSKCTGVARSDEQPARAHAQEVQHAGLSREACCIICKYMPKLL